MKQGSRMRWINSGGGDEELDKVSEASVAYADTADLSNRTKLYLNGIHVTDPDFYAPTGSGYDGQILRSNGENKDPTWQYETIAQFNGDNTSHNREIYGPTTAGVSGQVLESNGSGEPRWRDPIITRVNGLGVGDLRDHSVYVFESMGNDGQIAYGGGDKPTWGDPIIAAVNGSGGHSSKQIWAPESAGTSGQILQSNGSGSPGWVGQSGLSAGSLATSGTIRTNLASTSTATYTNGGNITPGVTGTLPVANGGTGFSGTPRLRLITVTFSNSSVVAANDLGNIMTPIMAWLNSGLIFREQPYMTFICYDSNQGYMVKDMETFREQMGSGVKLCVSTNISVNYALGSVYRKALGVYINTSTLGIICQASENTSIKTSYTNAISLEPASFSEETINTVG